VADVTTGGLIAGEYETADFRLHGYIGYPTGR
jgi:hypothetical protein